MGKRNLADQFYEQYKEEEPGELFWLVLYDFEKTKPSGKFYRNVTRTMVLAGNEIMLQIAAS